MKAVTSVIRTAGSVHGSQGVCIKRPFPAEQAHSSMFSCAKSGPLSGSGCEGMEKQRRRHELTAKERQRGGGRRRRERREEEEGERRKKKIAQSCSAAFLSR